MDKIKIEILMVQFFYNAKQPVNLSTTTTIFESRGWSMYTGLTVLLPFMGLRLLVYGLFNARCSVETNTIKTHL